VTAEFAVLPSFDEIAEEIADLGFEASKCGGNCNT